jgi:hypothetical protein
LTSQLYFLSETRIWKPLEHIYSEYVHHFAYSAIGFAGDKGEHPITTNNSDDQFSRFANGVAIVPNALK